MQDRRFIHGYRYLFESIQSIREHGYPLDTRPALDRSHLGVSCMKPQIGRQEMDLSMEGCTNGLSGICTFKCRPITGAERTTPRMDALREILSKSMLHANVLRDSTEAICRRAPIWSTGRVVQAIKDVMIGGDRSPTTCSIHLSHG